MIITDSRNIDFHKTLLVLVIMLLGIFHQGIWSQEQVEIQGAITLDNTETPSPAPGTIRWTGADFQGWNGITWVSFTGNPVDSVMDRDGNVYKTMMIGNNQWMVENLRVTQFNDGTQIPQVDSSWQFLSTAAYTYYNHDSTTYAAGYGALYNWFVVADTSGRNVCPVGWRVPHKADWDYLLENLDPNYDQLSGISLIAGGKLKKTGLDFWQFPNTDAYNTTGFSARGAGNHIFTSSSDLKRTGIWWSDSEELPTNDFAYHASVRYNNGEATVNKSLKVLGLSVRCMEIN